MGLIKFIEKFFLISQKEKQIVRKDIQSLKILDTIFIRDNNTLYEGWVFDITRRCIIVVFGPNLEDFRFRVEDKSKESIIEQDGKILYCNKPENEEYIKILK